MELCMRTWVFVVLIALMMGAGVTAAIAQPRMTFQCHDSQALVCEGRFAMNGQQRFLLGVYDSEFLSPPADGWESALFTGTGDARYYRGLQDMPINAYLNYWQGMDMVDQLLNTSSGVNRGLLNVLGDHSVMWW